MFSRPTDSLLFHAGVANAWGRVISSIFVTSCVCLSVCIRALKGKRPELQTPNLVHVYSMAEPRQALTRRSKGQRSGSHGHENRHGCMVASGVCCCERVMLLPAWVCTSYDCLLLRFFRYFITYFASVLLSGNEFALPYIRLLNVALCLTFRLHLQRSTTRLGLVHSHHYREECRRPCF